MNEVEQEKVEDYLTTVVNRLFAVQMIVDILEVDVGEERVKLVREGKPFAYQQGVLDLAKDIADYASGRRDLVKEMDILKDLPAALDKPEGYM